MILMGLRFIKHIIFNKHVTFLCGLILGCYSAYSTHIRAGEITARRINDFSLEYEFTFTGFRDTGSNIEFGSGTFSFGDGTTVSNLSTVKEPAGNGIEKVVIVLTHRYNSPARYVVSYEEDYRNDDIINMNNSVGTAFYVESKILIDPFVGLNNTPTMTVPPIDFGAVGVRFEHNPGAQDAEGDSISYRFTTPKMSQNMDVTNYRVLNNPGFYSNFASGSESLGPPSLTLDAITGDLVWDAPGDDFVTDGRDDVREYNVAFVIEEWRLLAGEYLKISEITRDMQIIVEITDNERPTMVIPEDICVEAGAFIDEIITADDPDGDRVKIEAFGGPFESLFGKANLDPTTFGGPPNFTNFTWQTVCGHVRERPYEVQFKVTDDPEEGPSLVDFETFRITVVGPPPTGLNTTVLPGKSIQLSWDEYNCSNASQMQVWRRVGNFPIEAEDCVVGMPSNSGFRLIKTVGIDTTGFLDNNFGNGLSAGANYCYRLVAQFPDPSGGKSYVSEEACDSVLIDVPAITNVDILSTSETEGEIFVRWTPPYQIDQVIYPPSYTYDLLRTEGDGAERQFVQIASNITDTLFTDTALNTFNKKYTYFVRFYDNGGFLVDSSSLASSVRLNLVPLIKSIEVNWGADVPWSLRDPNFQYHYIYRNQVDQSNLESLIIIDSVDITSSSFTYLDNGRFNDISLNDKIEYCYFISTFGSYDNPLIVSPLINRSQQSCAQPNDTIPPCPPPSIAVDQNFNCRSSLSARSCNAQFFINNLNWEVDAGEFCDDDISRYNVYFSETGLEDDYELIESVTTTAYNHEELSSYKGCYRVSSVDRSGNESELTMEICNDNCPVYKLPNVFTPNGDGINDFFTPLYSDSSSPISGFDLADCPRFVLSVEFIVADRSGNQVFKYDSKANENNIFINWDGKSSFGEELEFGVYFYSATLEYDVLATTESKNIINGWVQILK
jgi:hypothetical protein